MLELTEFGRLQVGFAALGLLFAVLAWRKREEIGAKALTIFLVAVSFSLLGYALDLAATTLPEKFFWIRISLLTGTVAASAWVVTALAYAGRANWLTRRSLAVLGGTPVAVGLALFLPQTEPYVATLPASGAAGPVMETAYEPGPVIVLAFIFLLVALVLVTAIYLQLFLQARHLYRTKAVSVLAAATVPWLSKLFALAGFFQDVDLLPVFWTISGCLLTIGLYRFRTLDPVPAAHESIVETMGNGVVVIDPDGRINDCNPSAASLLATDEESQCLGSDVETHFPAWDEIARSETGPTDWQQVPLDRFPATRYLEVRVAPFSDHHDSLVGYLVELRDVSDRERRERALARFRTIFESVDDPVYVLDGDETVALVNDSFASLVGHDRRELVGRHFSALVTVTDESESLSDDVVECTLQTATGHEIPVETHRTPIEVGFEGFEGGAVGFVRDISERKRVEEELTRTTQRYETLVEAAPLAILSIDTDGVIERWNPAAESLFGWSAEAITGDALPFVPETERDRVYQALIRVYDGEQVTDMDAVLERRDGSRFDAGVSFAPVFDASGSVIGAVIVAADVTDQKEYERTLRQQNERLDEFASVVSHDLRNPLTVATGNVELALETEDVEPLETVADAHDRMAALIDDFLTLAREGEAVTDPTRVALGPVVEDAWAMVEFRELTLDVQDDLGAVSGDESRIRTLLENLFRNAADHGRGDVIVTVGPLQRRAGFFVADDGPGIPPSERDEIFESGFTTNEDGTGFGLSIVDTIADAHGWSISVQESIDGGARFEFETGPYGERQESQTGDVPDGRSVTSTELEREL